VRKIIFFFSRRSHSEGERDVEAANTTDYDTSSIENSESGRPWNAEDDSEYNRVSMLERELSALERRRDEFEDTVRILFDNLDTRTDGNKSPTTILLEKAEARYILENELIQMLS
jgi:hypothetical protein